MERLILTVQRFVPDQVLLDETIHKVIHSMKESFRSQGLDSKKDVESEVFFFWWRMIMTFLLTSFFMSCVSHFAQYYQLLIDRRDSELLRKRLHQQVRVELTSPNSGRLKLPPPTPVKEAVKRKEVLR